MRLVFFFYCFLLFPVLLFPVSFHTHIFPHAQCCNHGGISASSLHILILEHSNELRNSEIFLLFYIIICSVEPVVEAKNRHLWSVTRNSTNSTLCSETQILSVITAT